MSPLQFELMMQTILIGSLFLSIVILMWALVRPTAEDRCLKTLEATEKELEAQYDKISKVPDHYIPARKVGHSFSCTGCGRFTKKDNVHQL